MHTGLISGGNWVECMQRVLFFVKTLSVLLRYVPSYQNLLYFFQLFAFVRPFRKIIILFICGFCTFALSGGHTSFGLNKNHRVISIYNIHTKQKIKVLYKKDGAYIPKAMAKINHIMRDWRRNKVIKIDPKLIDLMWEVHAEVGSKKPIYLISGFRSQKTNRMLRKTRGGQARRSKHILGQAADVHFPDVSIRRLRYSAVIRERGGVGYYPTSALPFVHLDTGRVRHWPRMPRVELAALFPNGRSKHVPRDGKPLTKADYRIAMAKLNTRKKKMIRLVHNQNRDAEPVARTQLANLTAPMPLDKDKLAKPQSVAKGKTSQPKAQAKRIAQAPKLKKEKKPSLKRLPPRQVASLGPKVSKTVQQDYSSWEKPPASQNKVVYQTASYPSEKDNRWVRAPSYEDEHPDELSYQPFPILPFMGDISVSDDVALVKMEEPDYKSVENLIGEPTRMIRLQFRPGLQFAEMLWASEFKGPAVIDLTPRSYNKRIVRNDG
ncbi:MAG: DUF882 domain-containing protein [Pseudomonadota bacterium]